MNHFLLTNTLALSSEASPAALFTVPFSQTLLFMAILVAMIVALAFEEKLRAKKSIIASTAAVLCLLLGTIFDLLPFEQMQLTKEIHLPIYIPAIDWEVIAIILGASIFVDVTSKSGIFSWIAIKLTKASRGDPLLLLIYYSLITVPFSAVLNNVTAMIIIGSLTSVSLKKLNRESYLLGFLLTEGLLTNVGGLLTLISSVPNIIVGQAAGIPFMTFFINSAPYVVIATIATIWLAKRMFKIHRLTDEMERAAAADLVDGFDENDSVESRSFFRFSAVALVLFILALSTASITPVIKELGLGFVALSFGFLVLIKYKHDVGQFYSALHWDLIFFFTSLFIIINVMEHAMVLALIGNGLQWVVGLGEQAGVIALLWCAALFSSVTDNIPLAAMLSQILAADGIPSSSPLWWAVIFGCNLGGNITPIGSASTVLAVSIIHRNNIKLTFLAFVKAAAIFAFMQLLLATVYVYLVLV